MFHKLAAHENAWVEAENVERLKTAVTGLVFGLALLIGLTGVIVGLLQR